MQEFFVWWLAIEAVGLAAFPLTFAFFRRLPDRGFAFSKPIGLILLAYGVWMGAVLGLFPNSRGSVLLVLLLIAGVSAGLAGRHREELARYLRTGWRYVAFVELLFLAVLAAAVFIRSFAPDIVWGEKPFELAFLNAIDRSETMPPHDPWLAGDSISYYYFGYVIVAAMTKLTALSTNVTFFLSLSLMAALTATTAFGLVFNMISASRKWLERTLAGGPVLRPRVVVFGVAAVVLMLAVSNLVGLFEIMARHGIGSEGFYDFLGIEGLNSKYNCNATPEACREWYPTGFWWWWKATRMGSGFDVQEFPFFSFQFGDLHPHVIVIPFLLTALGVALNFLLSVRDTAVAKVAALSGVVRRPESPAPFALGLVVGGALFADMMVLDVSVPMAVAGSLLMAAVMTAAAIAAEHWGSAEEGGETIDALWPVRHPWPFLTLAVFMGGIAFIDSWTVPLTVASVLFAAGVVNWRLSGGNLAAAVSGVIGFALPLVAAMYLFFVPFYLDLDSAVEGVRVNQVSLTQGYPPDTSESTRPMQLLLFWAPIMWVALSALAYYLWRKRRELLTPWTLALGTAVWLTPIVIWAGKIIVISGPSAISDEFDERGASVLTALALASFVMAAALAWLSQARRPGEAQDRGQMFAFQLMGFALLMMLGAELFYVKDLFSWRVNTVFRFWHQSWIVLSVVGAYGLYQLTRAWRLPRLQFSGVPWPSLAVAGVVFGAVYSIFVAVDPWDTLYSKWWTATLGLWVAGASILAYALVGAARRMPEPVAVLRFAWLGVTAAVLAAALIYPVLVTLERTGGFQNPQSLNGLNYVAKGDPNEYAATEWLNDNIEGTPVVLEATGPDYSDYARVSTRTGLPTVMGWQGHELQWRGYGTYTTGAQVETELTAVPNDIHEIYNTTDIERAKELMAKLNVDYVYVGRLERQDYDSAGLEKFSQFMLPVFQNESVTIYRMPAAAVSNEP